MDTPPSLYNSLLTPGKSVVHLHLKNQPSKDPHRKSMRKYIKTNQIREILYTPTLICGSQENGTIKHLFPYVRDSPRFKPRRNDISQSWLTLTQTYVSPSSRHTKTYEHKTTCLCRIRISSTSDLPCHLNLVRPTHPR